MHTYRAFRSCCYLYFIHPHTFTQLVPLVQSICIPHLPNVDIIFRPRLRQGAWSVKPRQVIRRHPTGWLNPQAFLGSVGRSRLDTLLLSQAGLSVYKHTIVT